MKSSKVCPKCEGTEIYTDEGMTKRGERSAIGLSSWGRLFVATYICASCGYIEEYIDEKDLTNKKKQDKLRANWKKI